MTTLSSGEELVEDKVVAPVFRVMGDSAIIVEIATKMSPSINRRVHDICARIVTENLPGIVEFVISRIVEFGMTYWAYNSRFLTQLSAGLE